MGRVGLGGVRLRVRGPEDAERSALRFGVTRGGDVGAATASDMMADLMRTKLTLSDGDCGARGAAEPEVEVRGYGDSDVDMPSASLLHQAQFHDDDDEEVHVREHWHRSNDQGAEATGPRKVPGARALMAEAKPMRDKEYWHVDEDGVLTTEHFAEDVASSSCLARVIRVVSMLWLALFALAATLVALDHLELS